MNQDSDGSTYGTAVKDQSSQKQEAGDSKPENEDDLRPTLIAARPVASGRFLDVVGERGVFQGTCRALGVYGHELKHIGKSFEQSGGQENMLEDDAKDIGGDKEAEVAPNNGEKGGKEESNRLLKFQISAPPAPAAKSRCTAGHGHCGCRRKQCRNKRAAGKAHVDGHCTSKSRSSSCHRRRHRSASSAADGREKRREVCSGAHKHPQDAPITHRRQRHHHYRHQRRMRDGDFSDGGVQTPPTASQKHRHCCRSSAASDSCCFRAPTKRASGGDDHRASRPEENGDQRENGAQHTGHKRSGRRGDTRGDNGAAKRADGTKCGNVFSRYRSNYRSAETDSSTSSSSSSSSEDDCGEAVAIARCKREGDGSRTFTFTQTRESSTQPRHPKRSPRWPNKKPQPRLPEALRRRAGRVNRREARPRAQLPGFAADAQHIQPPETALSSCLAEQERCTSRQLDDSKRVSTGRDRENRQIDKKGARCEGAVPYAPRIRRKHSYVRHTRRLKGRHDARQDDSAPSKALHPCSSSSSDSSEDDDANDVTYGKEKGTEEVVVRPAVVKKSSWRNRGAGREELAGGGSSRQRELRLTIPKVKSGGYAGDASQKRSTAQRRTKRSSKARWQSALEETAGDRGGDEGAGADNTVRIVFTDSRLNTELRCILQEGSSASQEERNASSRAVARAASSRALPARKKDTGGSCQRATHRRHQVDTTRKDNEGNTTDADSAREGAIRRQQCGCVSATQRSRPHRGAEDSDVVSSSYYSSTHESSVALNEATKAGSGCTLCRTIRAMGAKERPWRRHWQRSKHCH
ncbi:hypothetical protein MTO96_021076 [Rhipicephalus appendiculatus]